MMEVGSLDNMLGHDGHEIKVPADEGELAPFYYEGRIIKQIINIGPAMGETENTPPRRR
jgi:hypothetical protein